MATIVLEIEVPNRRMAEAWYKKLIQTERLHPEDNPNVNFSGKVHEPQRIRIPEFLDVFVTLRAEKEDG